MLSALPSSDDTRSAQAEDQVRPEQVEQTLAYLQEPTRYLDAVIERFEIDGERLKRSVHVRVRRPTVESLGQDFLFIALQPRKGVDIATKATSVDGKQFFTRLSHQSHIQLGTQLIAYRFALLLESVNASADPKPPPVDAQRLSVCLAEISQLPHMTDIVQATRTLQTHFTADGKLKVLGQYSVDFDRMTQLYRICQLLANRWLVVLPIPALGDLCEFRLEYSVGIEEYYWSWRGQLRQMLGAAPVALKLHIPWARQCRSYTAEIDAPDDHYFDQQLVVVDSPETAASQHASARMWLSYGKGKSKKPQARGSEVSNVVVRFDLDPASLSNARIFVPDGQNQSRRLYLFLKLLQRPPGALLGAIIAAGVSFTLLLVLVVWALVGMTGAPQASAFVIGSISLASTVVLSFVNKKPAEQTPVLPRVALVVQFIFVLIGAIWLYSEPNYPKVPFSAANYDWSGIFSTMWPGFAAVLGLAAITTWLVIRLFTSMRRYTKVKQQMNDYQRGESYAHGDGNS